MDDSYFRRSDDDSEEESPSIEDIVSAFRTAVGREDSPDEARRADPGGDQDADGPDTGSRDVDPEHHGIETDPASSPSSRASMIENTIVAFRKARRRSREEDIPSRGGERSGRRSGWGTRADHADSADQPSDRGSSRETGTDDTPEEPPEDFAPDFREALERRSGSDGSGNGTEADEPNRSGSETSDIGQEEPSGSVPSGHGVEAGDGIPPSEDIDVSESRSSGASGRPVQPGSSFLWVTDDPVDDDTAVSIDHLGQPRAREAGAFLLSGDGRTAYDQLTRIRGHSNRSIFLKPVFLMNPPEEESKVTQHVDGVWARDERRALEALKTKASSINRRVSNLVGSEVREDGGMELRVLRFMSTRNRTFEPQRTVENSDGFVYPTLTPLLDREGRRGGGELVQILSMLEERRLVNGEFVTHQHACQSCGCAFLNFEERCPSCGATHLHTQDLVHHFRCAFTGPLGDYKKEEGRLVCPKCDRFLKQIGVDYDKPSVVHTCRRCQEQFQDPEVQTTCYQCEQTAPPEQQVQRQVKTYEVTALGEETAVYGLSDSLLSILERESRVLDYATFQLIVESEAARIERYQRSAASLLLVQVTGLQQLRRDLGRRSQEVIEEIATAFDNTLRSSDYLSARDESLYLFLLTETDESGARRAGERLEQNLEGVLGQNLEHPPGLDIGVQALRPGVDLDDLAERFLESDSQEWTAVEAR